MYQNIGASAYKADLDNTLKMVAYLKDPQHSFKSIHVAGTNGKGSTSHMLASIFQEAGYKVGLYTSPHLKDFRERIKINGKMIPKIDVIGFVDKHKDFFQEYKLSFFEMTVGMALDFFRSEKVDIAIVEVGMGGRLDSTNVIVPEISVITNIGLDHTKFLGNSLPEIASEKAGIIKRNILVIIGETNASTKDVFIKKASELNAPIVFAENEPLIDYESDLKGIYQKKNIQTVQVAITELQNKGWKISEENKISGLKNTVANTGLMGRWQILKQNPKVICDTAHNLDGLKITLTQLSAEKFNKLHIVLGVVNDKDLDLILPLFPKNANYYFCRPNVPRGLSEIELNQQALNYGLIGKAHASVSMAYNAALSAASDKDVIYVGGSTFVVAEVL